jgi:hypothetical protein
VSWRTARVKRASCARLPFAPFLRCMVRPGNDQSFNEFLTLSTGSERPEPAESLRREVPIRWPNAHRIPYMSNTKPIVVPEFMLADRSSMDFL